MTWSHQMSTQALLNAHTLSAALCPDSGAFLSHQKSNIVNLQSSIVFDLGLQNADLGYAK
jgi:hypothetical protein